MSEISLEKGAPPRPWKESLQSMAPVPLVPPGALALPPVGPFGVGLIGESLNERGVFGVVATSGSISAIVFLGKLSNKA